MSDDPSSMQAIARNETLTALARVAQLVGVPVGVAFMSWLAFSVVGIGNDMAALKASFAARIETAQLRERTQDERITAMETRLWERSQRLR